ncbi:MAG: FAD-binding protein [Actinobacteria bacterium]|nr:FAD-binding protein [Actinomycetota bacterium]
MSSELIVAGGGMGGLAAAARSRELGASVTVFEKGDRPGGSMALSSGFFWRYRDFERFREECPGGDPELQRLVFERLDEDLAWIESLGAPVLTRKTGNPLTVGVQFDPRGLTDTLARRAGEIRLGAALNEIPATAPVILATGGFQGDRDLLRRYVTPEADELVLRANRWSAGDGLRLGLDAGGELTDGMDEFYGRNLPAPPARISPDGFRPLAQLYARYARVVNAEGERYVARTWSEIDVVQWTARQSWARAWYVVPDEALGKRVRDRTVGEMIQAARDSGAAVRHERGETAVEVVAGITTTLGGLRVDAHARVAEGVFACGADVGGISTGGYSSGLAAALVFGRIAAEETGALSR